MPDLPESETRADAAADAEAPAESVEAPEVDAAAPGVDEIDEADTDETDSDADADETVAPAETFEPDPVLLEAVDVARRALLENTAPETVGSVLGHLAEGEHVLTLHFASDLSGYPGWHWSVTLVRVEDAEPTILETQLMPGERALLAPAWIPWSERLADYRAAQAAAAEAAREDGADGGDANVDLDDASEELEIVADDEFDDDDDLDDDEDDETDDDDDDHVDGPERDAHRDEYDGIDFEELDEGALDDASRDEVRLDESMLATDSSEATTDEASVERHNDDA